MLPVPSQIAAGIFQVGRVRNSSSHSFRSEGLEYHRLSCPQIVGRGKVVFQAQISIEFGVAGLIFGHQGGVVIQGLLVDYQSSDRGAGTYLPLQGYHREVLCRKSSLVNCSRLHVEGSDAPIFIELPTESCSKLDGSIESYSAGEKRA